MQCLLVEEYIEAKGKVAAKKIGNFLVDFVFRCIRGPYLDNFIFINLVAEGESIGRDPDENLTLCIDDSRLSPKHAKIVYNSLDKKYILEDCQSTSGTWILLRSEFPCYIHDNMRFKIDDDVFLLTFDNVSEFNQIQQWLQRIELEKLNDAFEIAGITRIEDLYHLTTEYINKLDLNEVERMNLEQGIRDLCEDFKEDYQAFLVVISCMGDEQKRLLEVGWSGAVIGTAQYADLFLS